jgi:hypothetical protein
MKSFRTFIQEDIHSKIAALRAKTVKNGCTPEEEHSAQAKVKELENKYGISRASEFHDPKEPHQSKHSEADARRPPEEAQRSRNTKAAEKAAEDAELTAKKAHAEKLYKRRMAGRKAAKK